jgi:small subunit ribosomal protein S21
MSEGNIIIYVKDNETIDRALKRFKKKFEKVGVLKKLRKRMFYKKPSIEHREERLKAVYKQKMLLFLRIPFIHDCFVYTIPSQ